VPILYQCELGQTLRTVFQHTPPEDGCSLIRLLYLRGEDIPYLGYLPSVLGLLSGYIRIVHDEGLLLLVIDVDLEVLELEIEFLDLIRALLPGGVGRQYEWVVGECVQQSLRVEVVEMGGRLAVSELGDAGDVYTSIHGGCNEISVIRRDLYGCNSRLMQSHFNVIHELGIEEVEWVRVRSDCSLRRPKEYRILLNVSADAG
jgi:hypothetical protein